MNTWHLKYHENILDFDKRITIGMNIASIFIIIACSIATFIVFPLLMEGSLNAFNPSDIKNFPSYIVIIFSFLVLVYNYYHQTKYANSVAMIGWSVSALILDIVCPEYQASSILFIAIIFGASVVSNNYKTQIFIFLVVFSLLIITLFNIGYPSSITYDELSLDFIVFTIMTFCLIFLLSLFVFKTSKICEDSLSLKNKELLNQKKLIEQQKEKIIQLEKNRKSFFVNTAHELRTPLTLILGPLSSLAKEANHEPRVKESLEKILTNGRQMKMLVNQLLDIAKIENATLQLNTEDFDLNSFLTDILESFQPISSHRNINFQKDIRINKTHFIQTDKNRLKTIINNVLVNAFKFTDKKSAILFKAWENEQNLFFEIKDTGIGIESTKLPFVFDLFYQASNMADNQMVSQGSGVGLYIVKQYLMLLGGNIEVKSDVGFGTTFLIQLPNNKVIKPTNTIEKTQRNINLPNIPANVLKGDIVSTIKKEHHILIVEDSLAINNYIKSFLSDNYHIHQVYNGQEALTYLENEKQTPDLIISDVMMPEVDGLELLRNIRNSKKHAWIPTILLSCKSEITDKVEALKEGADEFLAKPFAEEELLVRINNLLKKSQKRKLLNKNHFLVEAPPLSNVGEIISQEDREWLDELDRVCQAKISNINLTIDDIAEEMSISRAQFFRRVKKLVGLNPGAYLQEVRLQKALQLICSKKYSTVKAVAYSVGFKSDKYFSKKFKNRFGVYPSKYHDKSNSIQSELNNKEVGNK